MASIKPIEGGSVHQIQSGQVIVDLCSVVKELVENSLDAHATSIDVRFKNNGLDSIEVQDNGSGISKDDYASVALKHYTSKLRNYDDLTSLQTFGFRGEALSSLCALSDVHIVTAREDEVPKGTRLDFETSGRLKGTQVVASQRGTTVAVEKIFRNLPVRRQELERNIKREYGKVLSLLQAYACISTNVKFSVSNLMAKGKKAIVFSTKSNCTTRENIANVFGAKTLSALISLDLDLEMQASTGSGSKSNEGGGKQIRVLGHVSKPIFGEGRQTPDRQMFFVNSRPCGLPQVAKVMNEVYKSYNLSQSPFIFANVVLDTNAYDVNVSPDKRTILLHDQSALLESIKVSLTELFERQQQTMPQSQNPVQKLPSFKPLTFSRQNSTAESRPGSTTTGQSDDSDQDAGTSQERSLSESQNSDSQVTSLIQKFLGRKVQERDPEAIRKPNGDSYGKELTSDKQRLIRKLAKGPDADNQIDEYNDVHDLTASDAFENVLEKPVQDLNQRIAEQQAATRLDSDPLHSPKVNDEENVPSTNSTPVKPIPGVVPNAFERMRPQRTPLQTATITIGSKIMTSTIGAPTPQQRTYDKKPKRRIHYGAPKDKSASQQFGNSLKAFAAPGSQIAGSAAEESAEEDEDEEDDEEDGAKGEGEGEDERESSGDEEIREQREAAIEETDGSPLTGAFHGLNREESGKTRIGDQPTGGVNVYESEGVDDGSLPPSDDEGSGDEYLDEAGKKAREEAKVAQLIKDAEERAARPSQDNVKRANYILKGGSQKDSTTELMQTIDTSIERIEDQFRLLARSMQSSVEHTLAPDFAIEQEVESAEERLSLTVSKEDFSSMQIIGQFNLGFIIAARPSDPSNPSSTDELFIIDQHASDEKYNFERLQATTVVQNQRLVQPYPLSLTAIEEEIILENADALLKNGFLISIDTSGDTPVGQRCKLLSLPMSREVTFSLEDLEELIALLADYSAPPPSSITTATIPRPSKTRKMFAMRACRSSVMIGKTLTGKQMEALVRRMGTIDKPWNCPHGRPTMRHLVGLGEWRGWREEDGVVGLEEREDGERAVEGLRWREWMGEMKRMEEEEEGEEEGEEGEEEQDE